MEKFIEKVVEELIQNKTDFSNTMVILPGNRPQLFFRKAFRQKIKNGILPEFLSIDDFIHEISALQKISQIRLWLATYKSYLKITETPEEFDVFLNWIPVLLKDFDDIQTALVNPREIFDYLVSTERIKKWGQENLEIGSNKIIHSHLYFWKMAGRLFFQLNEDLLSQNLAYRGLIYNKAVEKLPEFIQKTNQKFVFAGLNALSNAERKIVFELEKSGLSVNFWDSDVYFMNDSNQESGLFLREYKENSKNWNWEFDYFSKEKSIRVTGIGKRVGQAKYLHRILEKIPEEELTETAVVLADESLLSPVLSSIPEKIPNVNITMGFPLNKSSMAYFFRSVFELYLNREKLGKGKSFYFKNVSEILGNKIFKEKNYISNHLNSRIQNENMIFIQPDFLQENLKSSIYLKLFETSESVISIVQNISEWIENQMNNAEIEIGDLDKEYLYRFSLLFNQLNEELADFGKIKDFRTLFVLFNRLLQNETVSFVGEPLNGLQVVGLLETRLLDFKNVIITSVNDGILPPGRVENSYIPYDIRREMGMNTFAENDAVSAYHFYRLLQRAENVELLYNTETEGLDSGEKSRFIAQMEIESPHQIQSKIAAPEFVFPELKLTEIPKTKSVLESLESWATKGISPSSLSNYLRNPIAFYEQKILGISEFDEAEEIIGARVMGNIIHETLEELYQPVLGKILVSQDFENLLKELNPVFEKHFRIEYKSGEFQRGKNYLIYEIARSFVENLIKNDRKTASENELIIHKLEENFETDFHLNNGKSVKLTGKIDRVDSLNGTKRIIDYKTGSVDDGSLKLTGDKLPQIFTEDKFGKSLQLVLYAHLFFGSHENQTVQFGIYPLKFPKKGVVTLSLNGDFDFDNGIVELTGNGLSGLIEEILNPEIPFVEKVRENNSH
jgi:hypothetical protein